MADAVAAARKGQKTPEGYYNVERMLKQALVAKNAVLLCGACMDARGMGDEDLIDGAHAAARWTSWRQRHAPLTRC